MKKENNSKEYEESQFGNLNDTVKKHFENEMILYDIIDDDEIEGDEKSVFDDEISKEKLDAFYKVYPFCKNSEGNTIIVPNWAKELLYQRMTLNLALRVIKYFNCGGDAFREDSHPFQKKISHLVLENIDIKRMPDEQMDALKGEKVKFRIYS